MPVNKKHDEFYTLDMSRGWEVPVGYPAGIQQKIISGGLDEEGRRGTRTRLLRFEPGVILREEDEDVHLRFAVLTEFGRNWEGSESFVEARGRVE